MQSAVQKATFYLVKKFSHLLSRYYYERRRISGVQVGLLLRSTEIMFYSYRKRWSPPEKSRMIRRKESRHFQTLRWYPNSFQPFFKRLKSQPTYVPKERAKFIRNHALCGEPVVNVRFWVSRAHPDRHLTWQQLGR